LSLVQSRAPITTREYGENHCILVFSEDRAEPEIDAHLPNPVLRETVDALRGDGLIKYAGRSLIPGQPCVVYFDLAPLRSQLDSLYRQLANSAELEIRDPDERMGNIVMFGFCVARLLAEVGSAKYFLNLC
jgi:hypothetical protein